ncbi:MAG: ATP-binding protein [Planctomycetota bacterium]|jgi:signal transduction histidine kinase
MKLQTKIVVALVPVVLGYALGDHLIQRRILAPRFAELEEEHARERVRGVLAALESQVDDAARRAAGWQHSHEVQSVLAGERPADTVDFAPAFLAEDYDLMYLVRPEGQIAWYGSYHPDTREPHVEPSLPTGSIDRRLDILSPQQVRAAAGELRPTDFGPLLLASHPVLQGDQLLGRVILGRHLTPERVAALEERLATPFRLWPADHRALGDVSQELLDQAGAEIDPVLVEKDGETLEAYATIDDKGNLVDPEDRHEHDNVGRPTVLLRVDVDRRISARGAQVIQYALVSALSAATLLLFVLLRLLSGLVLAPLGRLTSFAERVGREDDTSARLELDREDELGSLGREFDQMLSKLEASRAEVIENARAAGMSEIATGILHNVGNVLNSVGVAAGMVSDQLQSNQAQKLASVVALLEEHSEDLAGFVSNDPRGQKLIPLLNALSRALQEDREKALSEVQPLLEGLEHVRRLVDAQQEFATGKTVNERIDLADEFQKAIHLSSANRGGKVPVEVQLEADLPRVLTDRHKLLQILLNLVQNARQAVEDAQSGGGVRVRASQTDEAVVIEVEDDGVGISPENLEKIFAHGFTTKSDGHGFGLHSAGNAATELGGALNVSSQGLGFGACFRLELPLQPEDASSQTDASQALAA